jgi:UTP:GlnB (protein PII) uridylyltransferase
LKPSSVVRTLELMAGLIDIATKAVSSARAVPEARAGCVLGSLARREHDSASDIDVLIVVSVGHADVARSVRRRMPRLIGGLTERSLCRPPPPGPLA